jgi:glutaminyl-peptide cyclotransferase
MKLLARTVWLAAICSSSAAAAAEAPVSPVVVRRLPHDRGAFTEGLVLEGGALFESTGEFGTSTLREVELETGRVVRSVALPDEEFGEGLAWVEGRLIQLTYRNGIAHVYDAASFEEMGRFEYDGEGWGLCFDGARLIMTNGSDRLFFRDPDSFELLGSVPVTLEGRPLVGANELECVGGEVFANVFPTQAIVRIDPQTGNVLTRIDARGLLGPDESQGVDVLNGIAFVPDTGRFLLTGKYWPTLFEVELPGVLPAARRATPSSCSVTAQAGHTRALWMTVASVTVALATRRRARRGLRSA